MTSNTKPIRILTADDHPILCRGIALQVNAESDMELVAQASTGREAIEQFHRHRPDVTLMDLQMPDMSGSALFLPVLEPRGRPPSLYQWRLLANRNLHNRRSAACVAMVSA